MPTRQFLIQLLDELHAPLIVLGVYFATIFCLLGLGCLFIYITLAICQLLIDVFDITGGKALSWTILGVPMFAGLVGLVWWGVRMLLITDRLVDSLEVDDDSTQNCYEIKTTTIKNLSLPKTVEITSSMVINKIEKRFNENRKIQQVSSS